ncbi:MAG: hypothetical protein ACFFCQ_14610 [Promethearchaeota archaeon]
MPNEESQIELSENEKEGLRAAAKIIALQTQLAELQETLEMLEIKFSVEESINESQYLKEKKKYLKQEEKIRKLQETSQTMEKNVPLLVLLDEGRQFRNRREKLTELLRENKISEAIFSKMDEEYQLKIEEIEQKLANELMRLEKIKIQLENVPSDRLLEELFARKAVGELDEKEYENRSTELKKNQKESKELLEGLNSILSHFQ